MKTRMSWLLRGMLAALVVVLSTGISAAKEKANAVYPAALLNFEERGTGVKDYGPKVADLLFAKLVADPAIFLVDRADLQKTLAEQSLNLTGAVNPDQAARVGQITGAQLLVTGSVLQVDKNIVLVAKIIGTQSSRVAGTSIEGKVSDDLAPLVTKLAEGISSVIAERSDELVPSAGPKEDRLAALKKKFDADSKNLPKLWISVAERHIGQPTIDPAVETELGRFANELGFTIIDVKTGTEGSADVILSGEGFSELAGRVNNLVAVKARVELKAVDRATGKVLFVDRQTTVAIDLAEQVAGKSALQEAGAQLAERALPKVAQAATKQKTKKKG